MTCTCLNLTTAIHAQTKILETLSLELRQHHQAEQEGIEALIALHSGNTTPDDFDKNRCA